MRIALIQDEIYLPSFAGGTKANRFLFEGLARHGHECLALSRALTRSSDGPRNMQQFSAEMKARDKIFQEVEPNVFSYKHEGVQVEALNFADLDERRNYLVRRVRAMEPDWIFVTDDKRRFMLQAATEAAPSRVILLLQTIIQLPFGPVSVDKNPEYMELIKAAQAIVVISNFMKRYIHDYGDLDAHLLPIPVYGAGPFPDLARFDRGFVTMINPCELKGVSIFIGLAREFPDIEFAAVPTWGADQELIDRMQELPNIRILKPANDIEDILGQTRILLVPSLWPETFGYVVPEAMLRGIPVLASDIGGLPEAKLGVDYVLPVLPGEFHKEGFVSPPQDLSPWSQALGELLFDEDAYQQCSQQSRQAAHDFVATVSVSRFEALMNQLVEDR
ncbi:MAG: glycosyltransferase family 4 protein [Gammaproteobacteria bacterium]|nr:glycosyltransferase family 4 protein [Gammaproteobacteria bacterium]